MPTSICSAPRCLVALVALACACSGSTIAQKLDIGADCSGLDDRCQSGLCYSVDTSTSLCTLACSVQADCPASYFCIATADRGKLCLPTGIGGHCTADGDCSAGFVCDTDVSRCYIRVERDLCDPCTSPRQCPTGATCLQEPTGEMFCTRACDSAACPAGYTCQAVTGATGQQCVPAGNTCNLGKGLCSPCHGDSECGTYADLCVRNLQSGETFCAIKCDPSSAGACATGFNCLDLGGQGTGPFQCVPNSGTCSGYCAGDDAQTVRRMCGLGQSCDLARLQCQSATDGRACAACEDDDNCPSTTPYPTRCVVNNCDSCPYKGEKFCAPSCTGAGDQKDDSLCDAGFVCMGLGTGGLSGPWQCVPRTGTCHAGAGQLGDDCGGRGGLGCLSGICLGFGAQALCSTVCAGDADCGNSRYRCCADLVDGTTESFDCTQAPGSGGGLCVPLGGGFGADCSPGQPPCVGGVCLDMGTAYLCTRDCSDTDGCPTAFSCQAAREAAADGSYTDLSVCFPDGGGDLGADCSFGPAACRSRLCIKKPSGNLCTVACDSVSAACPAQYDCLPETTVDNQSVQVCIPAGL